VVGRRSDHALYSMALATYGQGDTFDHQAAEGFIQVFGLSLRSQARRQGLSDASRPRRNPLYAPGTTTLPTPPSPLGPGSGKGRSGRVVPQARGGPRRGRSARG